MEVPTENIETTENKNEIVSDEATQASENTSQSKSVDSINTSNSNSNTNSNTENQVSESKPSESVELVEIAQVSLSENTDPSIVLLETIKKLLESQDKINELVTKSKIVIGENELKIIISVLQYLTTQTNNASQITVVINEVTKVLSDGKLELHEIPELISVISTSVKEVNIKLSGKEVCVFIKLIIYILMEVNVIKIKSEDFELISKVIDSSLKLLELFVQIPVVRKKFSCGCLPF